MNPIAACKKLGLMENTAYVKDVDWTKAKKEEGGLCFEILCEGDMPESYTQRLLDSTIKQWSKVKGAKITMIDYHS